MKARSDGSQVIPDGQRGLLAPAPAADSAPAAAAALSEALAEFARAVDADLATRDLAPATVTIVRTHRSDSVVMRWAPVAARSESPGRRHVDCRLLLELPYWAASCRQNAFSSVVDSRVRDIGIALRILAGYSEASQPQRDGDPKCLQAAQTRVSRRTF